MSSLMQIQFWAAGLLYWEGDITEVPSRGSRLQASSNFLYFSYLLYYSYLSTQYYTCYLFIAYLCVYPVLELFILRDLSK